MYPGLGISPAYASLPTDRSRPPVPSFSKTSWDFTVDRPWIDNVETLAEQCDVSTWCVLSAALAVVIARHAENDCVPIGVWTAGNQSESMVRAALITGSEQQRAKGLIASVAQAPAPSPEVRNTTALIVGDCESDLATMRDAYRLAESDVVVAVDLDAGKGRVHYDLDLFDGRTIERFLDEWHTVLRGFSTAPETPVTDLSLVSAAASRQLLVGCAKFPASQCIHTLVEEQVGRSPEAVAVIVGDETVSYAALNARANQLARRLLRHGVGPDQLVAVCLERSSDLVVAILGILKAGAAYLPIDPRYPAERVAFTLADATVSAVVTESGLESLVKTTTAPIVRMDAERAVLDREDTANCSTPVTPQHLAYVIYTSGSTGRPKGVEVTHHNVTRLFEATEHWFHFGPDDVWTLFHSAAFDFSVWELWGALLYGGRLVVVPYEISRSPDAFHALLRQHQVTVLNQTPSAFRQLIEADAIADAKDLALRYVVFGGEALELPSLAPWVARHGAERPLLVNMYGITETTVHVTYRPLSAQDIKNGSRSVIGQPIPDLRVYLLDRHRQLVPIGVRGEIYVGGGGVAKGYLNRPELTAERFVPDPFLADGDRLYRSGDLARRLANGDLEYLGRIDNQVKIRGFRIELGEIETQLATIPSVAQAVVAVQDTPRGDRTLIAYLVARKDAVIVPAGILRSLLASHLPDYMVPSRFVWLDRMPLSPSGKIDRRALPSASEIAADDVKPASRPETETERFVAKVWADVLGRSDIGPDQSFFEIGGDSLRIVEVQRALCARFGDHATVTALFRHPTIRALARYLTGGPESAPSVDVELRASRQRQAHARQRQRPRS